VGVRPTVGGLAESRRETSPRPFDSAHRHACHESTLAVEPRHEYSRWYSRWQDRFPRFLQGGLPALSLSKGRVFVQEPPSGYNVGKSPLPRVGVI